MKKLVMSNPSYYMKKISATEFLLFLSDCFIHKFTTLNTYNQNIAHIHRKKVHLQEVRFWRTHIVTLLNNFITG